VRDFGGSPTRPVIPGVTVVIGILELSLTISSVGIIDIGVAQESVVRIKPVHVGHLAWVVDDSGVE